MVVRFAEGFSPFLTYAATRANPIMPKEVYEQYGNFKDNLLGAGPFQLDMQSSQKGNRWVFKKNANYWEPGKPYLDEIRFVVLKDYSTVRAAYQTGQLDSHYVRNFRDAEEIRASVPDSVVYEFPSPPFKLWLSLSRPPTNDFRVRKAISLAVDRDGFVQTLAGGKGGWALGLSDALSNLFSQEEIKSFIKYDPNEARRLLVEAGHPNGVDVEVIGTAENAENMAQVELLQAYLRRAGINVVIKPVTSAEAATRRRQKDFEIITGVGARTRPDMDATLMSSLHPKGSNNYQGVDDAKVTELVFAQRRETDPMKRRELIRQAVRHVNESFTYVPTFRRTYYTYYRPYVRNYYPHIDSETRGGPGIAATWLDR